jgi:hypothetical protein
MRVRVWVETTVMRRGEWVGGTVNRSILREVVEDGCGSECDPSVRMSCCNVCGWVHVMGWLVVVAE